MTTQSAQELHEQGVRYYYGNGVEADEKKAIECFEQAIALGSIESKRALGGILLGNIPTWAAQTAEQKRGILLLEEAAAEGDKKAKQWFIDQYEYAGCGALLLKIRFGKAFDYQATIHHAKLAGKYKKQLLEAGDFDMLYNKAFSGLLPNKKIIEELANKEYAPAEYTLGAWYTEDYPYKKDLEKAKYWLTRAVEHGSEPAKEKLSKL